MICKRREFDLCNNSRRPFRYDPFSGNGRGGADDMAYQTFNDFGDSDYDDGFNNFEMLENNNFAPVQNCRRGIIAPPPMQIQRNGNRCYNESDFEFLDMHIRRVRRHRMNYENRNAFNNF